MAIVTILGDALQERVHELGIGYGQYTYVMASLRMKEQSCYENKKNKRDTDESGYSGKKTKKATRIPNAGQGKVGCDATKENTEPKAENSATSDRT